MFTFLDQFFVIKALLAGLVLVGVPIVLHLIMRQKPKHLLFPAFRFLVQRFRTNQRKLRLRHLLLLLLRILLIVLLCLALARARVPPLVGNLVNLSSGQPVAAVLVVDTSPSMDYKVADQTRLDEARRRVLELLDDLPEGSRVALLDTAEPGSGQWLAALPVVRERVAGLQARPANGPVTDPVAEAYRLFARLDQEMGDQPEKLPRFLYVFSDRTQESWSSGRVKQLEDLRDRVPKPSVNAVWVDVGADKLQDLAITSLELPRQAVSGNIPVLIRATVQATGKDYDTEILCHLDGDRAVQRQPVQLKAGQSKVFEFRYPELPAGWHQVEVTFASSDNLTFNNIAYATFEVRGLRQVLTVTDDPSNVIFWRLALEKGETPFKCEVLTADKAADLGPAEMATYQAVCLVDVADPARLWEPLRRYVSSGGGLAVVPGGDQELRLQAYNENKIAQELLPGELTKVTVPQKSLIWDDNTYKQPMLDWFREWSRNPSIGFIKYPPDIHRYWEVKPASTNAVIVRYTNKQPALLESVLDRKKYRGRVMLFTVPLDDIRSHGDKRRWHDYVQTLPGAQFYPALVKKTVSYLAGDLDDVILNYQCGQTVPIALPPAPRFPNYLLHGPGISGAESNVPRADQQSELTIRQAVQPGHFTLSGADGKPAAGFSMNVPWEESQLAKVPAEQIEGLFGKGAVISVPPGETISLRDALQERWSQPVELFPWLMILVLLVLAVENLLANKMYGKSSASDDGGRHEPAVR